MAVVYGVISYILTIGLIVGYFIVKKWGDRVEASDNYKTLKEEKSLDPSVNKISGQ